MICFCLAVDLVPATVVSGRFQLGQQFRYWDCRLHHNGEAVVPWFFREGPAFVTMHLVARNCTGFCTDCLHPALTGAYWPL
jgi:hypothetical protein